MMIPSRISPIPARVIRSSACALMNQQMYTVRHL